MIRSVPRPDGLLHYRLLGTGRGRAGGGGRRRARLRCASLLALCLLLACLGVAAAVILPIALSTSLVALPAKLARGRDLQGVRYFAILPVREAKSSEVRILTEARAANSTRASPILDWAIENREMLMLGTGGLTAILIFGFIMRRRCKARTDEERSWDLQAGLLSEPEEE